MLRLRPKRRCVSRRGLTLVEMLLVVTLLLVVAGMSLPALLNGFRAHTLTHNVDLVRENAGQARVEAIESGLTYQFRYEPGRQNFVIIPHERDFVEPDESVRPRVHSGAISEEVRFRIPAGQPQTVERLDREQLGDLPDAWRLAQTTWSAPVLFFPDGSATESTFEILNEDNEFVTLAVRGLTATVSASEITGDEGP